MENIPKTIRTPRLLLRAPQAGDGAVINEGIRESFDRLQRFLPWAQTIPTLQESEDRILNEIKRWNAKENLQILVFNSTETEFIGSSGLHLINWDIPKFELGAWVRTPHEGKGYISETLNALTRFAFIELKAKLVQCRVDPKNTRSKKMIERLGFQYQKMVGHDDSPQSGNSKHLLLYSRLNIDGLSPLDVSW